MKQTILKTEMRNGSPKQVRAAGFIPGVLHGPGTKSTSVQFEKTVLMKLLAKHGNNAKVWIELDKDKHFGLLKEIQKDPLDKSVLHVTIHLVSQDQEIKMHVPIVFSGRESLENRILILQPVKEQVELSGKAGAMPEALYVDVSERELGDNITVGDLEIPKDIRIMDSADEVYAVVKDLRQLSAPEPEEAAEDEDAEASEAVSAEATSTEGEE
ncbi:MAG: 50S ribosomal protein L25 [Clostridiales bacterium]|nr:50S ribosomal protein L25 [Clostridiales bacterium]